MFVWSALFLRRYSMEKYCLVGVDGNAFAIMAYVVNAMHECGKSADEALAYQKAAMSGDYNNLLCESMKVINRLNELVQ